MVWRIPNLCAAAVCAIIAAGCTASPNALPNGPISALAAKTSKKHTFLWVEGNLGAGNSPSFVAEYPLDGGTPHPTIWTKAQLWSPRPAFDQSGNIYLTIKGGAGPEYLGLIALYGPSSTTKALKTYEQGLAVGRPYDMIGDGDGNVFVANTMPVRGKHLQYYGEISVYPPGKTVASRAIGTGVDYPENLAFDRNGNLYVSNFESKRIAEYAPGGSKPIRTFGRKWSNPPHYLAFDRSGNLYVASRPLQNYRNGTVQIYDTSSAALLRTLRTSLVEPTSIAVDSAGYVFVSNSPNLYSLGTYVSVFAPGSTALARRLVYSASSYGRDAVGVAVDAKDNLYVGWAAITSISVYGNHGTKLLRTIATPGYPVALGFETH